MSSHFQGSQVICLWRLHRSDSISSGHATIANLRGYLRDATRDSHDLLDAQMRKTGWHDTSSYSEFLKIQLAARQPIESWIEGLDDEASPPKQCDLIAGDLAGLGGNTTSPANEFRLPDDADRLGVYWALAGSSLGNRSIFKELERNGLGHLSNAFLTDEAMQAYWAQLRPQIEQSVAEAEAESMAKGARAVFQHFRAVVSAMTRSEIAA